MTLKVLLFSPSTAKADFLESGELEVGNHIALTSKCSREV